MNKFSNYLYRRNIEVIIAFCAFLISTRGHFPYFFDLVICIIFLFYLTSNLVNKGGESLKLPTISLVFFLFFIFFILLSSVYNNVNPAKFIIYFLFFPFFICFFKIRHDSLYLFVKYLSFINVFICIITFLAFLGVIDLKTVLYTRSGASRGFGFIGNPNYFAYSIFINFLLLFLLYRFFKKRVALFISIALVLGMISSLSRGVLIATMFFSLIYFMGSFNYRKIIISIFLVVLFFYLLNSDFIKLEIIELVSARVDNLLSGDGSGRMIIWELGLDYVSQNPASILFGIGANAFDEISLKLGLDNTVHNSYLRIFYEIGICGFLMLFVFIISILIRMKNISTHYKIASIISISVSWLSNDFVLNKETWLFFSALVIYNGNISDYEFD